MGSVGGSQRTTGTVPLGTMYVLNRYYAVLGGRESNFICKQLRYVCSSAREMVMQSSILLPHDTIKTLFIIIPMSQRLETSDTPSNQSGLTPSHYYFCRRDCTSTTSCPNMVKLHAIDLGAPFSFLPRCVSRFLLCADNRPNCHFRKTTRQHQKQQQYKYCHRSQYDD